MQRENVPLKTGTRVERDWTKGSLISSLWGLSWPIIISSLLLHIGPVIDMVWVGKLGAASVAGVGVAGIAVQVASSARVGLQTGTRAMVARFVGGNDRNAANVVAQQTFILSLIFAVVIAIIGIFLSEPILRLLGVSSEVVKEGAAYMRVQFIGMVAMSFTMMNQSIMQASGDSLTPMKIDLGYRLLHIALCPFLVFGWWIFPRFGVAGAALSGAITQGLGGIIGLWILYTGRTRIKLTFKDFRIDWDIMWRTVKIGVPALLTQIQRNMGQLVMVWFVAPFGTFAVAAHSLTSRIDGFLHMPGSGLGQGAGILAGQNLGAGQPKRAEQTGWLAAALFTGAMTISSIVVWFWAPNVVRLFNNETGMVDITSAFLKINIITYMSFGMEMVLMNCLNNVGDTAVPLFTELLTMWALAVPLAIFLPTATGLGVYGVRWAIVSSDASRAIIYSIYFKLGRWKRKKV
jgi:putative MATE family efflux protein